jgi:Ca2+-binding RTX toxin-like protein
MVVWSTTTPRFEAVTGSLQADTLRGSAGADFLSGADGDDRIFGDDGDDTLAGGLGNDRFEGGVSSGGYGGAKGDLATWALDTGRTAGAIIDLAAETAVSGDERDTLFSIDSVMGSRHGDTIRGTRDDDPLLAGNAGNDRIFGGGGGDRLDGGSGDDRLFGGSGFDRLAGGSGDDTLDGKRGDDFLAGGPGRDVLRGGEGDDVVQGGPGHDRFVFAERSEAPAPGRDAILDFGRGADRLDVSGIDADETRPSDQAFVFIGTAAFSGTAGELRVAHPDADTLVQGDLDGDGGADFAIELTGRIDLTAADFAL